MEYSELVGKVIADRNSRKLGLCVDIRRSLISGASGDKPFITMMVKIERVLRDAIIVEVEAKKILKIEGIYAWIDTTKEEFNETIKNARKAKLAKKKHRKADLAILKNHGPPPPSS